jgi:uncharacterized protein HemX
LIIRRRGIGIVGASVIGGAAYRAGKSAQQNENQQEEIDQLQQQANQQASQQQQPSQNVNAGEDQATKLKKLADLHSQGILSDDEFTAAKKKILDGAG